MGNLYSSALRVMLATPPKSINSEARKKEEKQKILTKNLNNKFKTI